MQHVLGRHRKPLASQGHEINQVAVCIDLNRVKRHWQKRYRIAVRRALDQVVAVPPQRHIHDGRFQEVQPRHVGIGLTQHPCCPVLVRDQHTLAVLVVIQFERQPGHRFAQNLHARPDNAYAQRVFGRDAYASLGALTAYLKIDFDVVTGQRIGVAKETPRQWVVPTK